jgi:hypothetical protein
LANGRHEECSFVRGRDADKNPSPPIILRRRLKTKAILSIAGIATLLALSGAGATRQRHKTALPNIPFEGRIADWRDQTTLNARSGAGRGRLAEPQRHFRRLPWD